MTTGPLFFSRRLPPRDENTQDVITLMGSCADLLARLKPSLTEQRKDTPPGYAEPINDAKGRQKDMRDVPLPENINALDTYLRQGHSYQFRDRRGKTRELRYSCGMYTIEHQIGLVFDNIIYPTLGEAILDTLHLVGTFHPQQQPIGEPFRKAKRRKRRRRHST